MLIQFRHLILGQVHSSHISFSFPNNSRMSHGDASNVVYSSWNTVSPLHFLSALVSSQRRGKKDFKWLWHILFLTNSSWFQFITFFSSRPSWNERGWVLSSDSGVQIAVATCVKKKQPKPHLQQVYTHKKKLLKKKKLLSNSVLKKHVYPAIRINYANLAAFASFA